MDTGELSKFVLRHLEFLVFEYLLHLSSTSTEARMMDKFER